MSAEPLAIATQNSPTLNSPTEYNETGALSVQQIDAPETLTILSDSVEDSVRAACRRIAPLFPLESFVAVNPYLGMADRSFGEAAERLASAAGARSTMPASYYLDAVDQGRVNHDDLAVALAGSESLATLDVAEFLTLVRSSLDDDQAAAVQVPTVARVATQHTGKDWTRLTIDRISGWASAYFDDGQAMWRSADERRSVFASWREDASIDRTPEVMGLAGFRAFVRSLPADPIDACEHALHELGIGGDVRELYLHAVLLQVGGWSAHAARIVWDAELYGGQDDTIVEFLAVLLSWELGLRDALVGHGVSQAWGLATARLRTIGERPTIRPALARRLVLQDAFDAAEQRRIIEQIRSQPAAPAERVGRAEAQAVFCIDVRSEVFRRNLESVTDDVDTIGFAGFFGFAIEYIPLAHDRGETQCPVLLTPGFTVLETVNDPARLDEVTEARRLRHHVRKAWKSFKMGAVSCFSFVGPVGLIYLPKLFTDGYGRTRPIRRPEDEALSAWAVDQKGPSLEPGPTSANVGIPLESRIQLAEGALRAMSLADDLSPLVLINGHGATTVNNPYDTGLDCGACGGHTGEANSRVAVAVLNDPAVRAALVARNLTIPEDTWFVAGQHDTTTDQITLYDRAAVPGTHAARLDALEAQLAEAGHRSRIERARRLGIPAAGPIDAAVIARSADWAQVRPEWGLAGCRAFIVAPRTRTQNLDLGGRSFLHSYDWRQDEGFGVLELVMTAPMVVASWISLQYFASTVENDLFGSGNKTLHNVVGRLGVLEGNAGDLRVGLPWQSVHDGEGLQHEPLKLNVIIEAPIDAMNNVLAAHPSVNDLCQNGWLRLLAMDDTGSVSHRYVGGLRWDPVSS